MSSIRKAITEYLKKEKAFEPRYKHLGGQHPQKRHGFRGAEVGSTANEWGINVPSQVLEITNKLAKAGYQAVVVGGAVRDSLLGMTPHDFDIASSATPEQVKEVFGEKRVRSNAGEAHGTVLVLSKDGTPNEITTFRRDVTTDGRHAVVQFSGLADDLMRRDLTVNALAFEPTTGKLYGPSPDLSPEGALKDLNNRVARFVGDGYARITEDSLRALRLPRFARKMNGTIAPESALAVQEAIRSGLLPGKLSGERIAKELLNTLRLPEPRKAVEMWDSLGLTDAIIPEIKALRTHMQNIHHGNNTVWQHTLEAIEDLPKVTTPYPGMGQLANMLDGKGAENNPGSLLGASRGILALATMLHDTGKPATASWRDDYGYQFIGHERESAKIAQTIAKRLKLDSNSTRMLVAAVEGHMIVPKADASDKSIRKWLRTAGDTAPILLDIRHADATRKSPGRLLSQERIGKATAIAQGKVNPLPVSGIDVMNITGLKPGPDIGKILAKLTDLFDENPGLTREDLLKLI